MGTAMLGVRAMARGASWSGKERNHLFMNRDGGSFAEVSGISGLDDIADGRVFALFDMDRDGWQDIALINTNAPRFKLFRNTLGDAATDAGHFVALRLRGGNRSAAASDTWSARDGYGALISVEAGELGMKRELRNGEGLSAQNSDTLLFGLGPSEAAELITIRWPSGRVQALADVAAGTLLEVFEDPSASPTGEAFVRSTYGPATALPNTTTPTKRPRFDLVDTSEGPPLTVYTTTATWCSNCLAELPQFEQLRAAFDEDELSLLGVPYDDKEGADDFAAYRAQHAPAYTLLEELSMERRAAARLFLEQALGASGLPASVVTNRDGEVLLTSWGLPTVSELRELLDIEGP